MTCRLLPLFVALLACGAISAADAPKVGAAVAVAAQAPDARAQRDPACAFDGEKTFLVAWQQGREYYGGEASKLYAARVDADGKALDAKPIALPAGEGSMERPRVAFSKGVFLVVWQDFRSGKNWDVYAARVKPDGTLLDTEAIAVSVGAHDQALPDVAPSPNGFLVVWQDRRDGKAYEMYAARFSPEGKVLDEGGVALKDGDKALRGGRASVVLAGGAWHLVWWDPFRWREGGEEFPHYLARIAEDASGLHIEKTQRIVNGLYNQYEAGVAGTKTRLLYLNGGAKRSARMAMAAMYDVTKDEALKNPNDDPKKTGASGWNVTYAMTVLEPHVPGCLPPMAVGAAADGDLFLVAVRGKHGKAGSAPLRILRIGADARKLDKATDLPVLDDGATPCMNPAVAGGNGGRFLVCYESDGGPGKYVVVARIVDAKGAK